MAFPHGSRAWYVDHKCRCDLCVKANTDYQREWRKNHPRDRSADGRNRALVHGTTTGYNYGCRCDECAEAVNIYQRVARGGTAPKNGKPKYGTKVSGKGL